MTRYPSTTTLSPSTLNTVMVLLLHTSSHSYVRPGLGLLTRDPRVSISHVLTRFLVDNTEVSRPGLNIVSWPVIMLFTPLFTISALSATHCWHELLNPEIFIQLLPKKKYWSIYLVQTDDMVDWDSWWRDTWSEDHQDKKIFSLKLFLTLLWYMIYHAGVVPGEDCVVTLLLEYWNIFKIEYFSLKPATHNITLSWWSSPLIVGGVALDHARRWWRWLVMIVHLVHLGWGTVDGDEGWAGSWILLTTKTNYLTPTLLCSGPVQNASCKLPKLSRSFNLYFLFLIMDPIESNLFK